MVIPAIDPLQWVSKLYKTGLYLCLVTRVARSTISLEGPCAFPNGTVPTPEVPYGGSFLSSVILQYPANLRFYDFGYERIYDWDPALNSGQGGWATISDPVNTTVVTGLPPLQSPEIISFPDWTHYLGESAISYLPPNTYFGPLGNDLAFWSSFLWEYDDPRAQWIPKGFGLGAAGGVSFNFTGEAGIDNLPVPNNDPLTFSNNINLEVLVSSRSMGGPECRNHFPGGNHNQEALVSPNLAQFVAENSIYFGNTIITYEGLSYEVIGMQIAPFGSTPDAIYLLLKMTGPAE